MIVCAAAILLGFLMLPIFLYAAYLFYSTLFMSVKRAIDNWQAKRFAKKIGAKEQNK